MTALYIIAALVFGYLSGWHAAWNQMQQQRIKQLEAERAEWAKRAPGLH